jgi:exopolysaccharide biosynthesis polyprenyl glycosylphosphotransferase
MDTGGETRQGEQAVIRVAGPGVLPGPVELSLRAPDERTDRWGRFAVGRLVALVLGPLLAATLMATSAADAGTAYESGVVVFLAFALSAFVFRRPPRHVSLLPVVAFLVRCAPFVAAAVVIFLCHLIIGIPDELTFGRLVLCSVLAALPVPLLTILLPQERSVRVALIGSRLSAEMLARELMVAGVTRYQLVGVVTTTIGPRSLEPAEEESMPILGSLNDLGELVQRNRIDLVLMTGEAPRMAVFEEMARSCLNLPVRLWEMTGFYEETFGHVPVAEINASWFQYIMHPRYRAEGGAFKRALDISVAIGLGIFFAPIVGLFALLVKRDGGPAFFRQVRIGEGGKPFTLIKLRTMRVSDSDVPQWATADDERMTKLGRFLRRSHLDELPQLWNVLSGDMSLVGPRPEQPGFVERLEETIPFYSRRHLIKPGVTGWAQVRCGYAGSEFGSAWKLCHDLYYLKHRSFWLDCAILVDTLRKSFSDPGYDIEPVGVSFILRPALEDDDTAAVAAL